MPVPSTIADLTTNEATNSPADAENVSPTTRPSDYLRAHAAIIKQLAADSGSELSKADGNFLVGDGTNWVAESGATARASLGLTIGTDVQAYDATLTALAGTLTAADKIPYATALNTAGELTLSTSTSLGTSDTTLCSQNSIKTYVDTKVAGFHSLTSGTAQASTSGTSIDFTGIPSWAKRVTILFSNVSTNGSSHILVQPGVSTPTTSGYLGGSTQMGNSNVVAGANYTTGFGINDGAAGNVLHGSMVLSLVGSNLWVSSHSLGLSNAPNAVTGGGSVTLAGTLDMVRITTVNGTDALDLGSINILYE